MRYYFRLLSKYISVFLKSALNYKVNFLLGGLTNIIYQAFGLLFIEFMFRLVPIINGWSRYELLLVYGFSNLVINSFNLFFSGLMSFSATYVITGRYDIIRVRPANTLFQIICEKIDITRLITSLISILIIYYSIVNLEIEWTFSKVVIAIFSIFFGALTIGGLTVILTSISFVFKSKTNYFTPLMYALEFSKYPISLFPSLLQFILTWIIPFGFISSIPISVILSKGITLQNYLLCLPLLAVIWTFGIVFWKWGEKAYSSAGA